MSVRGRPPLRILACALCVSAQAWAASRTHLETAADLGLGRAEGMAVSSAGRIWPVARLALVGRTDAGQVWSLAARDDGDVFLGTGPDGTLFRIRGAGSQPLWSVGQPLITALAVARDGALLAATAPDGLVYRIEPDGAGEVWLETGERYVWSIAVDAAGRVFAATGDRGRVLELHDGGRSEILFDSEEAHVVSLAALPGGDLLAGGAGRGVVYRIDAETHVRALHDDDLPEVAALAARPDGTIFAALQAAAVDRARRPALRLRLPEAVDVEDVDVEDGFAGLEEREGPTLRGVIEGLPAPAAPTPTRPRSRIVRIAPDGAAEETWRSSAEAAFCLGLDREGRLWFGTGEPARIYRVEQNGEVARIASLDPAQVSRLALVGDRLFVATSNPAALYRLEEAAASGGSFLSRPFDAGGLARWGRLSWTAAGPGSGAELYTRTGNSAVPDATWSAWSPMLAEPAGSPIVNPDGRYLQWQLRQAATGVDAAVSSVRIDYEPYNRPPELSELTLEDEAAAAGSLGFRWAVREPDGDPLDIELSFRRPEASEWTAIAVQPSAAAEPGEVRKGTIVWDTTAVEEGRYRVRLAASDGPGHPVGAGREDPTPPELDVVVDRSPPMIVRGPGDAGVLEVRVDDAVSAIRALELRRGGHLVATLRPVDGVSDSPSELYRVELPAGAREGLSLRGVDAAGNTAELAVDGEPASD